MATAENKENARKIIKYCCETVEPASGIREPVILSSKLH